MNAEQFMLSPSPLQEEALKYWMEKRGAHRLPRRKDIAFPELVSVMPYVVIFDVLADPENYQYRLVGTKVRDNTFEDYTGRLLSDLDGKGPGSQVWAHLDTVKQEREPFFCEIPYVGPKEGLLRASLLFLPLADDHENTDMIFLVTTFHKIN